MLSQVKTKTSPLTGIKKGIEMKIDSIKSSRFMKREDIGDGLLLTISGVEMKNVAPTDEEADVKPCCNFQEIEKPLVLNVTNFQSIIEITGEDDSDNWGGKQIVLYFDSNIFFSGKKTGGIRVRKPVAGKTVVKTAATATASASVKKATPDSKQIEEVDENGDPVLFN